MAKRVDRALEADPFAAALLAREYLSLVTELDVNPLNQRGRTDAWTSAFVRLRVASNILDRHALRGDGEAYLVARAEERRLLRLFGSGPRAELSAVRAGGRKKQAQKRAFRVAAWLSMIAGLVAAAGALAIGRVWTAAFIGVGGALCGAGGFTAAWFAARATKAATQRAVELEGGISGLAQFDSSDRGRALIQRIQKEHPLLVRTSLGSGSSNPPAPSSGNAPAARK